jgi:malonyl-CoA/methylmalonyl-CoA synthetase
MTANAARGTVGFPLPGVELKITDPETGADMPPGEIGRSRYGARTSSRATGRCRRRPRPSCAPTGSSSPAIWGAIDAEGYVHIVGRNKDLIISGGYNIYPKEIELILDEQPGVLESAVIGVPHPDFGETVLGLIVPQPGEATDLDAIAAAAAARSRGSSSPGS